MFLVIDPRTRLIVDIRPGAHDGNDGAIKDVGDAGVDPA